MSSSTFSAFNSTNFEQQSQQARWRALIPPARRKCRLQTSHKPARMGSQCIALMTLACRQRRCRFRRVTQLLRRHHSDARPLARFVQESVQDTRVCKSLLQCCALHSFLVSLHGSAHVGISVMDRESPKPRYIFHCILARSSLNGYCIGATRTRPSMLFMDPQNAPKYLKLESPTHK